MLWMEEILQQLKTLVYQHQWGYGSIMFHVLRQTLTCCGWASEILHQLKTVVNIPLFSSGFKHPVGDAGFVPSTVSSRYVKII